MRFRVQHPLLQVDDARVGEGEVDVLQHFGEEEPVFTTRVSADQSSQHLKPGKEKTETYESKLLLIVPPNGMFTLSTVANATSFLAVSLMAWKICQLYSAQRASPVMRCA